MGFFSSISKAAKSIIGGGSGSSAKSKGTSTMQPAKWDPESKALWNEFMSIWRGEESLSPYHSVPAWFDPVYYLKKRPDVAAYYHLNPDFMDEEGAYKVWQHYEKYGQREGTAPNEYSDVSIWKRRAREPSFSGVPDWFDPVYYLKKRPDVVAYFNIDPNNLKKGDIETLWRHYVRWGKQEGTYPNEFAEKGKSFLPSSYYQPTLKELVGQDVEAKKAAGEKYLENIGGAVNQYEGDVGSLWNETGGALSKAMKSLSTPDVTVKLGNFAAPIISTPTRLAATNLANVAGTKTQQGVSLFDNLLKHKQELESQRLAQGTDYTPATNTLQYLSILQPLATGLNQLRYNLPSTIETGSMGAKVPLLSQLAGGISVADKGFALGKELGIGSLLSKLGGLF